MSKIAHLRVYPIKKGMESKWIELFSKKLIPEMKKAGIVVETAWMDKENSKFIWVRSYGSTEKDIEVCLCKMCGKKNIHKTPGPPRNARIISKIGL